MNRLKYAMMAAFVIFLLVQNTANAFTLTSTSDGWIVPTQEAYTSTGVVDGFDIFKQDEGASELKSTPLSRPEDIYIDRNDLVYVADTGNSRIVVFDAYGNYVSTFGEDVLASPTGVFVDDAGHVYVADSRKEAVYRFNPDKEVDKVYGRPTSHLFGEDAPYKPKKVIVDKRGNLYIAGEGTIHGLIEISMEGTFLGYFGGNRTGFELKRFLQKMIYSEAQMRKLIKKLPPSASNLAVDQDGLIYTTTEGLASEEIKRLNVAGKNLLPSKSFTVNWKTSMADIAVDRMGNIFGVDSVNGWVYEYDRDGNLLFLFGGLDVGYQRLGRFKSPTGIAVSSDGRLFVIDNQRSNIQIFKPTRFADTVHQAISYYLDGRYVESEKPWIEVLRLNGMFDLARTGIGMAAFKKGDFEKALEEFEVAHNKALYSEAYWELRRDWLMENASSVIIGLAIGLLALFVVMKLHKKYNICGSLVSFWKWLTSRKLLSQLLHVFRMLRHPIDGYWEIEAAGKGSVLSATLLIVLVFFIHLYKLYETNFLFTDVNRINISIFPEIYKIFIPFFAWVIMNYLVSTINDGEGKFKDVYKSTSYALSPYIVFAVPLTVLSKGLTNMEAVIYDFSSKAIILWCALLFFIKVKEVHGYELGESVKNVALTLFGMGVMAFIAFILFGLSNQVTDFIQSIYQEVKLRAS